MGCYVLMGVSGCGKSSVGAALAQACGLRFVDGDDLHPQSNIAKMSRGDPLDDADRAPWLVQVGQVLAQSTTSMAIGCSALKRQYRDIIRMQAARDVHFLHLDAPYDVLAARIAARKDHFMPPALLRSQFDALERLEPDELGTEIDIAGALDSVIAQSQKYVRETMK